MRTVIPNILTLCGFCAGFTSIRFAFEKEWELAVGVILLATVFDFLDGFAARILKGASQLGAELDSLSDLVCFGVAPAILLYQWTLHEAGWVGWIIALLFCICSALRLARFNTQAKDQKDRNSAGKFFRGVPAPGGAAMALAPMYASFQLEWQAPLAPNVTGILMVLIAFLMISTLPTFSLKKITLREDHIVKSTVIFLAIICLVAMSPWAALLIACFVYTLTIPMSVIKFHRTVSSPYLQERASESWK